VNEFRVAGVRSIDAANRYLRDRYLPQDNATFRRPPVDLANAFVPVGTVDLDAIPCQEEERVIAPDNTVMVGGHLLQIERQPGRRTCAGLRGSVRQHLDGTVTVTRPPDVTLRYTIVTRDAVSPAAPARTFTSRRRRKTGLGRWPEPDEQFASVFPKRTDHVSNG